MEKTDSPQIENNKVPVVSEKKKLLSTSQNFQYTSNQQVDNLTDPRLGLYPGLLQMFPTGFNLMHPQLTPWQTSNINQNFFPMYPESVKASSSRPTKDIQHAKPQKNKKTTHQKPKKPEPQESQQKPKPTKPLTKEDFPSLSGQAPAPRAPDRPWLPLPTHTPKPPAAAPTRPPKAPKKRNLIARLDLELIDIPVRVAQELEKRPTPASFALLHQHNPAIRRTGAYKRPAAAAELSDGVAHTPKKKESKFQKIKMEYLEQVRTLLSSQPNKDAKCTSALLDNTYLNKIALGYSEEVKKQSELVNSSQIRANYPVNIAIREFLDNMLYPQELEKPLLGLLNKVSFRYQLKKRQFPLKAKKRLVSGLKEVTRAAKSLLPQSLPKLVVMAVDLQRSPQEKGLDDAAIDLIELLKSRGIPYVFCGTRSELGASLYGQVISSHKVKAACVALIDLQGYEAEFNHLLEVVEKAKNEFEKIACSNNLVN